MHGGPSLSISYSWNELQLLIILFLQKVQKKSDKEQNTATTINKNNKKYKVKNAWSIIIQLMKSHPLQQQSHKHPAEKEPFASESEALNKRLWIFIKTNAKCEMWNRKRHNRPIYPWLLEQAYTCSDNRKQIVAAKCLSCFDWYAQGKRNKNAKLSAFVLRFFPIHSTQWWLICILLLSEI